MPEQRTIAAALAELPPGSLREIVPILRILAHDLNGAMCPITMEAFTLGELATSLTKNRPGSIGEDRREEIEILREAARSLQDTAHRIGHYLGGIREVADGLGTAENGSAS